jgi:hypothetical protein
MARQVDLQDTLPDSWHFNNFWHSPTTVPPINSNGYITSEPLGLEPNEHHLSDATSCPIEVFHLLEFKQLHC